MTTIASDWNDIGAVVDYVRALRHVEKLNLVGWSLGGPRAGGYAAQHPENAQLVLLAPAYNRDGRADAAGADSAPTARRSTRSRTTSSPRTGTARSAAPISTTRRAATRCGRRCSRPIRWAPHGARGVRRAPAGHDLGLQQRRGREDADADADGVRRPRQAGAARPRPRALRGPRRAARRCSSTWPAPRTTRCGRRITCCCSRPRSNG